ncbi:MAG: carbon storage regulator CsrA [Candidatus Cloacimonetes bacterium]|nr:carbon storage regulator CsrA [Candidatus Cloacimonadota bacterium]
MLVLTRKSGEAICIGEDIELIITEITKSAVRVGIKAPKNTLVYRKEVFERILQENEEASHTKIDNTKLLDLSRLITKNMTLSSNVRSEK